MSIGRPPVRLPVRQAPGWWPNLVRAACEGCDWTGPTRNVYDDRSRRLLTIDRVHHQCPTDNR